MRHYIYPLILIVFFSTAKAQVQPDSGRFIIHRHLKVVGAETYRVVKPADGGISYRIECNYSDRGSSVPLKAMIAFSPSGEASRLEAKGNTSRFTFINDTLVIGNNAVAFVHDSTHTVNQLLPNSFPVDGYAPASVQWLLVREWQKRGRPEVMNGLPGGPLVIRALGVDSLMTGTGVKVLQAFGIKDLIWGWEYLWIDEEGQLAGLSTINAEGDKIEFINQKYPEILFALAKRSAEYGVSAYSVSASVNRTMAVTNGVLVDITTGKEYPHSTIIVQDGKISWTGPSEKATIPPGASVTDARGQRMLPGLWDMHAHLKQVEWGPAYIAAGVTTVRDMANEFVFINALKESIDKGTGIGPTILRAGIIDGPGPLSNGIMVAETPDQAIALVKKYKAAGFEQIKLYSSLSPAIVKVVCEEAHREGLSVTGHIPRNMTTMQTIDLGLDQVAHLTYIYRDLEIDTLTYAFDLNAPANRRIVKDLLDKKIVIDPTIALFEFLYRDLQTPVTNIEPAFYTLPPSIRKEYITTGLSPDKALKRKAWFAAHQRLLLQLYRAGVPIVAGTDMLLPGFTLYREIELYVTSGLTPLEALQAATLVPARVMGRLSVSGTLEVGKQADIILVDGDPLHNIREIRKVTKVIKGGQLYDSREIHRMVGFDSGQ